MPSRVFLGVSLGMLLQAALAPFVAAQGDTRFVDPQTWKSGNGNWALHMDPSEPDGAGKAAYSMHGPDKKEWSATFDWTLRDARLSNNGTVIGYAYDTGYEGWGGNLYAVVIGPDGNVLAADAHKRGEMSMASDPPPPAEPRGNGVILDESGDRGLIRTTVNSWGDKSPAEWWTYRLSDGKHLSDQTPPQPASRGERFSREIAAELVPDTSLILVHWYCYGPEDAHFDLIDRDGKVVWSKTLEDEYKNMGERWRWWDLFEQRVHQIEVAPSAFTLSSFRQQRVSFRIEHKADTWVVAETGRAPGAPASEDRGPTTWDPKPLTLKMLGEVTLGTKKDPSPIDGITGLSIDGQGRLGWVRWSSVDGGSPRFVLVDSAGKVIHDIPLDLTKDEHSVLPAVAWLNGDRWLICRSVNKGAGVSVGEGYFLDVTTGKLAALPEFPDGYIKRICRTADGGFICLGSLSGNYTIRDQVNRFDPDGKPVSSKTEPGYGQGDLIKDICVLTDGSVAELIAVPDVVKVWRPGAADPEAWDVADSMHGDMVYLGGIRADKEGGIVLHEIHAGPVLYRFDKNRKLWQTLNVHGPNGESFRLYDPFAVAPDGRVWVSDHSRLFRLDDKGTADLALGGPVEGSMAQPVALTFDKAGAIYTVEKGTGCVHIFEPDGKPRRVLRPLPTDVPTQDALAWIQVADDGSIRYRMNYEGPVMAFGADGSRKGPEAEPADRFTPTFVPVPGSKGAWETDYRSLRRVKEDHSVIQVVTRRPGGEWFRSIKAAAAAPDGSLAVICEEPGSGWGLAPPVDGPWLSIFSADGKGVAEEKIPEVSYALRLSYDGARALVRDEKSVTVVPVPFGAPTKWAIPDAGKNYWTVFTDPKTGDWLTWAAESYSIQRWQAPK